MRSMEVSWTVFQTLVCKSRVLLKRLNRNRRNTTKKFCNCTNVLSQQISQYSGKYVCHIYHSIFIKTKPSELELQAGGVCYLHLFSLWSICSETLCKFLTPQSKSKGADHCSIVKESKIVPNVGR